MKPPRIFVQLGRLGDILNILPLVKRYHDQTGEVPILQVAAEFMTVLEGVSYCRALPWFGPWDYPLAAMREASKVSLDITLCQIHGAGLSAPRRADSFAREAWLSAGADVPWGSLPLVFDRRDYQREADLVSACSDAPMTPPRKLVLFAGSGKSSPFPFSKWLTKILPNMLGQEYRVLDLSNIHAHRFYDLLGLFDRAHCLISIDTAHQHLAAAVPSLPVIALVTRDPCAWHGSPWRPQQVARFAYDEFPKAFDSLAEAVQTARSLQPTIVHAWCDWRDKPPGPDALRRAAVAQASWQIEYATGRWLPCEMKQEDTARTGQVLGDPHPVPFIHDVMNFGMNKLIARGYGHPNDIICFSNADVGFTPGLTGRIFEEVGRHGAIWTHRRDFNRIDKPFISEAQVKAGEWYPGTDLIACTVKWWMDHRHELGDFVAGREAWDEVFRQLIKYHGGGYIEHACWHEWHESFWCGEGRWQMPGNVHNYKLRDEWFARTGFVQEDFRYFRVVEGGENHPKPYPNEPDRAA